MSKLEKRRVAVTTLSRIQGETIDVRVFLVIVYIFTPTEVERRVPNSKDDDILGPPIMYLNKYKTNEVERFNLSSFFF